MSRLLGSSRESAYAIRRIIPFDDGGFFSRTSVFEIYASSDLLEGHVLPSGGTFGLFAVGDAGFLYLNRNSKAIESLLHEEGRPLNEGNPRALARLFSEALLREGNRSADVVSSVEDIASYGGVGEHLAGQYEVNASELDRIRPTVRAPSIVDDGPSGWRLEYCAVYGWMHDKTTLTRQQFNVDREFRLKRETNILSRRIFSRTPQVRY